MTAPKPYRPRHRRRQQIQARIPAELKDRLYAILKRDNTIVTDAIEEALEAWVEKRERIPSKAEWLDYLSTITLSGLA